MVKALTKTKREIHRIHESGDMYSQAYLNKWIEIAKQMPHVFFYTYTKAFKWDYSQVPSNMRVIFDAIIVEPDVIPPEEYFHCQGDCKVCSHCYNPKTADPIQVAFNRH
jgi:hypothetical protein